MMKTKIKCGIAILAAGKGTRLKLDIPKALAPLLGKTLIDYVIEASERFCTNCEMSQLWGIVVGHKKKK
jgi:bifunctional UDP-N-acetylglucosamine pyrophosphorylase/glucosamine-1-phosphate N-acetyltransferase